MFANSAMWFLQRPRIVALPKKSHWRLLQVTKRKIINTYVTFWAKPPCIVDHEVSVPFFDDTGFVADLPQSPYGVPEARLI